MTENALVPRCHVAIVGAGPYGLAVAAHLRPHGLDTRMFGEPMEYWRGMPRGMLLRSPWHASSISDPHDAFTLDAYEAAHGVTLRRPIPLEDFIAYGQWFQEQVVPDLDRRRVREIAGNGDGFRLDLTDGSAVHAERVVLATGLLGAAHRLPQLADLPPDRVWHTADLRDPADLSGKRVLVVGGGQSATESAALLHEAGADVELVVRAPQMRWLVRSGRLHRSRLRPLLYPDTDVGPPVLNQIVSRPRAFRCFPRRWQERMAYRAIRPAAAGWLKPRLEPVTITNGRTVVTAIATGDDVVVRLDDGSQRRVDHIAYTLANWDTDKTVKPAVEAELKRRGLNIRVTEGSFHVPNPDGFGKTRKATQK